MGHLATSHADAACASTPASMPARAAPVRRPLTLRRGRLAQIMADHGQVVLISLSLNLILLAFFIVLNGAARLDGPRVSAALDSVRQSFAVIPQDNETAIAAVRAAAHDRLRNAVSAAFATVVSGREVVLHATADRIDVAVPVAAIVEDQTGRVRDNLALLDRIATIVADPPTGTRYAVMATAPGGDNNTDPATIAGDLAAALIVRGVAPALVLAGLAPPDRPAADGVTFSFLVLDDADDATRLAALRPSVGAP
ncbi:MAG: hypothetical protein SFV21_12375 [Rhodospirillaceae bacterium]|nr:hypothetical protein [Rhodospirillaceae bacterium]